MKRFGVALVLVAVLGIAPTARAATITVNDAGDPETSGCGLNNAIDAANSNGTVGNCVRVGSGTSDTINFSLPSPSTIMLASELPEVTSTVDITGPGSGQLTLHGADTFRPFSTTAAAVLSISGMTITHGLCSNACFGGGAIRNTGSLTLTDVVLTGNASSVSGGANPAPEGGAIWSRNGTSSVLHLVLSTVSGNTVSATGGTTTNNATGGGIAATGTITLDRSTVSGNTAVATGGAGGNTNASAGGISNGGQLTVTQSTISGNSVSATVGATGNSGSGGGISMINAPGLTTTLERSTVTGNTLTVGDTVSARNGGGIFAIGGSGSALNVTSSTISGNSAGSSANVAFFTATTSFKNSIVSNPLGGGANCNSTNSGSQGFNIEDTNICGFNQATDQPSTNPMLDSTLANNGGPTKTLALLTGSPAIDRGLSAVAETADQRGLPRPSDFLDVANAPGSDATDVGAFELQAPAPPVVTTQPDTTPPDTFLSARLRKGKHKVKFKFSATEGGVTFRCSFDRAPFAPCTQPVKLGHLRPGKHRFAVEAKDAAGNVDPTPAVFKFKIKR